jgi:hypothetical protein
MQNKTAEQPIRVIKTATVTRIMVKPFLPGYVLVHLTQSILYSFLALFCYIGYKTSRNKLILPLIVMSFIYGFLLIVTINNEVYNYLRGFIWYDVVNYLLIYRCVEMFVLIKAVTNGKFIARIRNTFINHIGTRSAYFISNNSNRVNR